jgi:hypothetical protein
MVTMLNERGDLDPLDYLSSLLSNPNTDEAHRILAANYIMPYRHSKMGTTPPQRFVETIIHVPEFRSIDDVEKFLNHLTRHVARGSLSIEHGKELADLARQWVQTHYADDELRMKIAASLVNDPNHPLTIHIEGGMPDLPGTNIIMPERNGAKVIDAQAQPKPPAHEDPDP